MCFILVFLCCVHCRTHCIRYRINKDAFLQQQKNPSGVTEDFFVVPPTELCALRSTQPLKVSTRDFSWGKGDRCLRLTTYHRCSVETSRKSGAPLATSACCGTSLLFTFFLIKTCFRHFAPFPSRFMK